MFLWTTSTAAMPHFVKHSNQLQDGIQPVRLFSVRALIHIHRTRSIIHWQFFFGATAIAICKWTGRVYLLWVFWGTKTTGQERAKETAKTAPNLALCLTRKSDGFRCAGGWREVGVLVLPRSNAFQFNAARSSEACQVAGAAGGYGGAERER